MAKIIVNLAFAELDELYQFGSLVKPIELDWRREEMAEGATCTIELPESSIWVDDCRGWFRDDPRKFTNLIGAEVLSVDII
jgi:hypothetical protein